MNDYPYLMGHYKIVLLYSCLQSWKITHIKGFLRWLLCKLIVVKRIQALRKLKKCTMTKLKLLRVLYVTCVTDLPCSFLQGSLVQIVKEHVLHCDLSRNDVFTYYTTVSSASCGRCGKQAVLKIYICFSHILEEICSRFC